MTHDPVNNPKHYNQNGIEVIDVIETYAKTDFRLANVLKYVCRCEYKGHKLEDLKKAAWYLARVIAEEESRIDESPEVVFDPYGRPTRTSPPMNIAGEYLVVTSEQRVAGDDAAAERVKNSFYNYRPFEIRGYCANCDHEITLSETFLTGVPGFDASVMFCSDTCVRKLKDWQGRTL
jgi:hypothetical protein